MTRSEAERTYEENLPRVTAHAPLDKPLRAISAPFPDYPAGTRTSSNTGSVQVRFFIGQDGSVSDPTIVGSPPPLLAALTLHAIMRWRFEPPMSKGRPTGIGAQQIFVFKLE